MAPTAVPVCSVDSTRWPVVDASAAAAAVSGSRISPITTMLGSWRSMAFRLDVKVMPTLSLTCTCVMPSRAYSTGSSIVTMLAVSWFSRWMLA